MRFFFYLKHVADGLEVGLGGVGTDGVDIGVVQRQTGSAKHRVLGLVGGGGGGGKEGRKR